MVDFIGPIGALLTTISFLPQVLKVIETKDVSSISLSMYIIFVVGVILWTAYGFILNDLTIIVSNGLTTVLAGIILFYKFKETYHF